MAILEGFETDSHHIEQLHADIFIPPQQPQLVMQNYMLERRGAVSDDVVMTKLTKALQIQIGAVERYN